MLPPKRHEHEKKHPLDPDSLLAKTFALKHLMSLGLPPQASMIPAGAEQENTKALVVKKPNQKARAVILHQIYKTPGM